MRSSQVLDNDSKTSTNVNSLFNGTSISESAKFDRSFNHIRNEVIEFLWMLQKEGDKSCKIIHYKYPLLESMLTSCHWQNSNYAIANQPLHIRYTNDKAKNLVTGKKINLKSKNNNEINWSNTTVYIPECIGHDPLSGKELDEVLAFYSSKKVKNICIFFGRFENINIPIQSLPLSGKRSIIDWKNENAEVLKKYEGVFKFVDSGNYQDFGLLKQHELTETFKEKLNELSDIIKKDINTYIERQKAKKEKPSESIVHEKSTQNQSEEKINVCHFDPTFLLNLENMFSELAVQYNRDPQKEVPYMMAIFISTYNSEYFKVKENKNEYKDFISCSLFPNPKNNFFPTNTSSSNIQTDDVTKTHVNSFNI